MAIPYPPTDNWIKRCIEPLKDTYLDYDHRSGFAPAKQYADFSGSWLYNNNEFCADMTKCNPLLYSTNYSEGTGDIFIRPHEMDSHNWGPSWSWSTPVSTSDNPCVGNPVGQWSRQIDTYWWHDKNDCVWVNIVQKWKCKTYSKSFTSIFGWFPDKNFEEDNPCPPGTVYNPETGMCDTLPDWDWDPDSGEYVPTTPGIPHIPPEPPGILPDPDEPDLEPGDLIDCITVGGCELPVMVELTPDVLSDIVPVGYNENFNSVDDSDLVDQDKVADPEEIPDPVVGDCTTLTEECIYPGDEGPV